MVSGIGSVVGGWTEEAAVVMEMLSRCEENGINYYYSYFGVKVGEGHGSNQSLRANWSVSSYWLHVTTGQFHSQQLSRVAARQGPRLRNKALQATRARGMRLKAYPYVILEGQKTGLGITGYCLRYRKT